MAHWLLKTEPNSYSIDDLERDVVTHWDGVRSIPARSNLLGMREGETAFFYHSSCAVPGVVGVCEVVREAYPDHTAWDLGGKYYDARSSPEQPRWFMPDVQFVERFADVVPLATLRRTPGLEGMSLLRLSRLSVQFVSDEEWDIVSSLARQ